MRLEALFRLSTYVTLGMACLCLGYAEAPFLPWVGFFGAAVGVVLLVAFLLEGRWSLSLRAANFLGFIIALASVAWVAYHVLYTAADLTELSRPAAVLPYLGPVLMVLLAAKLFRPKQIDDFWLLHSLGLLEVGLACVLASDVGFGFLMVLYLGCAFWSLGTFYLYRGQVPVTSATTEAAPPPGRLAGLLRSARLSAVIMAVAALAFLLTPQHGETRWTPIPGSVGPGGSAGSAQTGFSADVNLNRAAPVSVNEDIAMEVMAEDAQGHPKLDLPATQRWRGAVREHYEKGSWLDRPHDRIRGGPLSQEELPDLGPDQYYLTFTVESGQGRPLFLADPVVLSPRTANPPVVSRQGAKGRVPIWLRNDGSLLLVPPPGQADAQYRYRQVVAPTPEPDVTHALFRWQNGRAEYASRYQREWWLCFQPVPRIRAWTWTVLRQLVARNKLRLEEIRTEADVDAATGQAPVPDQTVALQVLYALPGSAGRPGPRASAQERAARAFNILPENAEKVARALQDYLSASGEYRYTLDLRPPATGIDPTEDFLLHSKEGHCQRFATGLCLMLRSCGIGSRMVIGYRGMEPQGNGRYLVRQSHAHAWVEALIQRPSDAGPRLHWLSLDATPQEDVVAEVAAFRWGVWRHDAWYRLRTLWRAYVVDYNTQQQHEMASTLAEGVGLADLPRTIAPGNVDRGRGILVLAGLVSAMLAVPVAGMAVLRRFRRNRGQSEPAPARKAMALSPCYGRLVRILTVHLGLDLGLGQTPREYGRAAETVLRRHRTGVQLAWVPGLVVQRLYAHRFGGQPPTAEEDRELDALLGELEAALASSPAEARPSEIPHMVIAGPATES